MTLHFGTAETDAYASDQEPCANLVKPTRERPIQAAFQREMFSLLETCLLLLPSIKEVISAYYWCSGFSICA